MSSSVTGPSVVAVLTNCSPDLELLQHSLHWVVHDPANRLRRPIVQHCSKSLTKRIFKDHSKDLELTLSVIPAPVGGRCFKTVRLSREYFYSFKLEKGDQTGPKSSEEFKKGSEKDLTEEDEAQISKHDAWFDSFRCTVTIIDRETGNAVRKVLRTAKNNLSSTPLPY